jgi:hypothetical protein
MLARMAENDDGFVCSCGHEHALHDARGCMAFLGAFAATADRKTYCRCPSFQVIVVPELELQLLR